MNFYHKLLELPEADSPPDHYELLGVPRFTDDKKQIHAAAVSRNTQLRGWQISNFHREANALMGEVAAASIILEDPIKKAAYDAELRLRLGITLPSTITPPDSADTPDFSEWDDLPVLSKRVRTNRLNEAARSEIPSPAKMVHSAIDLFKSGLQFLQWLVDGVEWLLIKLPLAMFSGEHGGLLAFGTWAALVIAVIGSPAFVSWLISDGRTTSHNAAVSGSDTRDQQKSRPIRPPEGSRLWREQQLQKKSR